MLRPSPTMVSMEPMVSQLSLPMDTQLSTTMASARLRPRPSPTMVSMEPMVSQLSPPTDTHLSTTMASARLRPRPSPTMVSMEPMVSQPSPPTDTQPSTTTASVRPRLNPSGGPDTSQLTALPHTILMATTCPSKLCKLICCAELLTFFVLCTNPLDPKLPCYSKEMFKSYTLVFFVKIVMKQINVTNS